MHCFTKIPRPHVSSPPSPPIPPPSPASPPAPSYVNESMVTGEARPVLKEVGDRVLGGTVNVSGSVHVRATHVGSETALAQIVRLVEAAQMAKAPIQKLADKISAVFVPVVSVRERG